MFYIILSISLYCAKKNLYFVVKMLKNEFWIIIILSKRKAFNRMIHNMLTHDVLVLKSIFFLPRTHIHMYVICFSLIAVSFLLPLRTELCIQTYNRFSNLRKFNNYIDLFMNYSICPIMVWFISKIKLITEF